MKFFKNFLLVLVLGTLVSWLVFSVIFQDSSSKSRVMANTDTRHLSDTTIKSAPSAGFITAVTSTDDSTVDIIRVSSREALEVPYSVDPNAGKPAKRVFTGRRINIAVTGVDSRLGTNTKHADANHVISILIDSGIVEITSIPRDTPADAGMPDTSGQNKLTIVRANKGRTAYLSELARIAGLDKIHYYVEAGFSQVMGILELLGFQDSKSALQVLRSRTGLGGDDYQRCYNQGQFIRQTMVKHFGKSTGVLGELVIRGGLAMVETNLDASTTKSIVKSLEDKGFPRSGSDVTVRVRPPMFNQFKVYDFTDQKVVYNLKQKIEGFNISMARDCVNKKLSPVPNVASKLWTLLNRAVKDSASRPNNVISSLQVYFDQRAWLQVADIDQRTQIREHFANLLSRAYEKKKQPQKAAWIREVINTEKELFSKPVFND